MPERGVKAWQIVKRLLITAIVGLVIGGGIWLLSDTDSDSKTDQAKTTKTGGSDSSDPDPAGPTGEADPPAEPEKKLPPVVCPPDIAGCVSATGRVLYVEKVDPDGDGDAHFVTASTDSVTGPGITIFDVRTDLRPDPLPGVGDLVAGAGPVYPGHAGQMQIEVVAFRGE